MVNFVEATCVFATNYPAIERAAGSQPARGAIERVERLWQAARPVARDLDPRRLETFRVVATLGKISVAARALFLSQPAVTAQVRQLEDQCGAPLFVRTPRGMTLNERGRVLFAHAQRLREMLDEASAAVSAEPSAAALELTLAASTTVASYVLPALLVGFARSRPGLSVRLDVGNTEEVLERVKAGRAPLGLVEGHARAAGIRLRAFLADELVATVGQVEKLRVRRLADLEKVPLVWREPGSGTRAVTERALRKAGSTRRWRRGDLQLASTEAIKTAVSLGAGLGFLSRVSMRKELASGTLRTVAIPGLRIPRAFSWVLPAGEVSGVAGDFFRFAAENSHQLS
jgi:DNA-binding transcriptional LysR family regulator